MILKGPKLTEGAGPTPDAAFAGKSFTRLRFMRPLLAKAARENHKEEMGFERK